MTYVDNNQLAGFDRLGHPIKEIESLDAPETPYESL